MSNGSIEKESEDDTQCIHCGRWYTRQGNHVHEQHCEFANVDYRVVQEIVDHLAVSRIESMDEDVPLVDSLPVND
jgi:hypothetical protein